tara:strand:+ start:411 stop:1070 length:660 start_codon:yes stop_codon:yes gene_type:complete
MQDPILELLTLVIGTISTAVIGILMKKYKDEIFKYFVKGKVKVLVHHRFFTECETVKSEIGRVNFTTHEEFDKVKTKLMLKIVELKCNAFKEEFEKIVLNKTVDNWSTEKLHQEVHKAYSAVLTGYNTESKRIFRDWGISEEDSRFLIEKYETFRSSIVKIVSQSIDDVILNTSYRNNYLKLSVFLELASAAVTLTPSSVLETFKAVNGRFVKYKNLML